MREIHALTPQTRIHTSKLKRFVPFVAFLTLVAGCPAPSLTPDSESIAPAIDLTTETGSAAPPVPGAISTSGPGNFDGLVRDNVQRVSNDETQRDLLDRKGSTLRFAANSAAIQNVTPGQLVLFDGVAGGRVRSVENDGDAVVVKLEDVPLTELIDNGTLTWDKTLLFSPDTVPEIVPGFEDSFTLQKTLTAQPLTVDFEGGTLNSFTLKGESGGFKIEATLTPESGRLNIRLTISRAVAGRDVFAATVTGFLENLRQLGNLEILTGTTRQAEFELKDLRGEVEVEWAAFNPGAFFPAELFQLQIPVVIPFRFAIGPIPVTVKVGIIGRVLAQLSVRDMSSRGSIKVSFDGEGGVVINEAGVRPLGGSGVANELAQTGENSTAGAVTTALSMGAQFPHIEVGILMDSAKAFVTVDTFVTGFFDPGLFSNEPPCQSVELKNRGIAGFNVTLLGMVEVASGQQELWKNEKKWVSEGSTCDGG